MKKALIISLVAGMLSFAGLAHAQSNATPQDNIQELTGLLAQQQQKIDQLSSALEQQRKLIEEQNKTIERILSAQQAASNTNSAALTPSTPNLGQVASLSGMVPNAAPAPPAVLAPAASQQSAAGDPTSFLSYDHGFELSTADKLYSVRVNGLFQPRFTEFKPQNSAVALGSGPGSISDFDVFLGRLALSGTAFDPSLKYFAQYQVSTSGNNTSTSFIDWFVAKSVSKAFTVQMGRSWTPYSYENYDSPGQYLFADFSSAEYAFALSRAIGAEVSGDMGRFSYAVMIGNSIPALDAAGQENFNSKLAYIGHMQFDLLAPYGYQESDPSPTGAERTELTLWASIGYNPVASGSNFSNWTPGDKTVNATTTLGFRKRFFTLQSTGFYRNTEDNSSHPGFNSWGYAEQAAYYLVPGRFELAGRLSGVNWGAPDFLTVLPGGATNTWYSGPNFPFHRVTEHTVGVNYYAHGHNAKLQFDYSYLTGNTFDGRGFGANRLRGQAQLMF